MNEWTDTEENQPASTTSVDELSGKSIILHGRPNQKGKLALDRHLESS